MIFRFAPLQTHPKIPQNPPKNANFVTNTIKSNQEKQ